MHDSSLTLFALILALFLWLRLLFYAKESRRNQKDETTTDVRNDVFDYTGPVMRATFATGSFWCAEPVFHEMYGVIDVISWYAWWTELYPTHKEVATGSTSHREAVQVIYDPSIVSYNHLLETFWWLINPEDEWGQFVDRWFQYTTAIFYHTIEQEEIAIHSFEEKDSSDEYDKAIVTEILPYTTFFLAESEHQDFYLKEPIRYERYKRGSGRGDYFSGR